MNFTKLWNNELYKLDHLLVLVGSRRVLKDLPAETDWDFMMADTPANRQNLKETNYVELDFTEYHDKYSTALFVNTEKNTQVVLKKAVYFEDLIKFWNFMEQNPQLFELYIWKSCDYAPKTKEEIQGWIEFFMDKIVPFLSLKSV